MHAVPYKRIAGLLKAAGTLLLLCFCMNLQAQEPPSRAYQLKAIFLFNFTQFVQWPATAVQDGPFVIGILGEDPFGSYLDRVVAGEQVNGKPIVIKRFKNFNSIQYCNILFIAKSFIADRNIAALSNRGMLTVSDGGNFMEAGGIVKFVTENNKINMQVNPAAAKVAGIEISSKLLRLAEIWPKP